MTAQANCQCKRLWRRRCASARALHWLKVRLLNASGRAGADWRSRLSTPAVGESDEDSCELIKAVLPAPLAQPLNAIAITTHHRVRRSLHDLSDVGERHLFPHLERNHLALFQGKPRQ